MSRVEAANYVGDVIESYAINGYDRYEARDKANSKLIGMCGFLLGKNGYTFSVWILHKFMGQRYCVFSCQRKFFILEQSIGFKPHYYCISAHASFDLCEISADSMPFNIEILKVPSTRFRNSFISSPTRSVKCKWLVIWKVGPYVFQSRWE